MPSTPNVVLVTTDQQRADATAREGFDLDTTPFLDSLADDGVWFDRAYTSTPVCGPARVSLLTGRFPSATVVRRNDETDRVVHAGDLFGTFSEAGYTTALVGKNHSHLAPEDADHWFEVSHWGANGPAARAERTARQAAFDGWMEDLGWGPSLDPTPFPVDCQAVARVVDHATEWVAEVDGPFFLWLSIPEPHNPYQAPDPYFSLFDPERLPSCPGTEALSERSFEWRWSRRLLERRVAASAPDSAVDGVVDRMRATYYGTCRLVDDQVRRFVASLDEHGHRDDTLLVVTADHGDFVGQYGLMRKGPGLSEATTRVPLVVAGPGVDPRDGPHPAHVSLVDVFPTLCDAIGVAPPPGVQGRSFWPQVSGTATEGTDDRVVETVEEAGIEVFESVYAESGDDRPAVAERATPPIEEATPNELNPVTLSGTKRMVRRGDWKLVATASGGRHLYDLSSDPAELDDRWEDPACADRRQALTEALLRWSLRVQDGSHVAD